MDKAVLDSPKAEHEESQITADLSTEPYGPPGTYRPALRYSFTANSLGFRGIAASRYVAICASFSAIGGLLFGYEYVSRWQCDLLIRVDLDVNMPLQPRCCVGNSRHGRIPQQV